MPDSKDAPESFDDLLAEVIDTPSSASDIDVEDLLDEVAPATPEPAPVPVSAPAAEAEETPEQRRIRELEAQLAAPLPDLTPSPEEETPEQRRIKELEDQLAKRNAMILDRAPETFAEDTGPGEKILIHFLEDGFTAFGQVWSKGQEIEIVVGSPAWKRTLNSKGKSWLDMRNDPTAQRLRYGKILFGEGPYIWREGEEFDVDVARADARRGRRVPVSGAGI